MEVCVGPPLGTFDQLSGWDHSRRDTRDEGDDNGRRGGWVPRAYFVGRSSKEIVLGQFLTVLDC